VYNVRLLEIMVHGITCFPMTLNDLSGHFDYSRPFLISIFWKCSIYSLRSDHQRTWGCNILVMITELKGLFIQAYKQSSRGNEIDLVNSDNRK